MYVEEKQLNKRKIAYIVLAVILVILITSGSVYAYLKWNSGLNNKFTYESSVDPTIQETFDESVKKDVSVNVGKTEYSVYVRVAIVATWTDDDGNVHAKEPVRGTDYLMDLNLSSDGWFAGDDGYYYYTKAMPSEGSTAILITECKPLKSAPDTGYTLNVDIIAQTIQSAGTTDSDEKPLVTEAWGVTVDSNGNLTK